jgi:predicted PurR-regulated permease PerM
VLIVTISGGALFGTIGLVLAAPLTSAAVKISEDVARARAPAGELPTPKPGVGRVADAPSG